MIRYALVLGFSEQCYPLCKQLLLSFYNNIISEHYDVDAYLYTCNYEFIDKPAIRRGVDDQENQIPRAAFKYLPSESVLNIREDLSFWPGQVYIEDCSNPEFEPYATYLPDISVYQHFADHFAGEYKFVIYAHDDLKFTKRCSLLDCCSDILTSDYYSIITEYRVCLEQTISLRFDPSFIVVNQKRFHESNLRFINDLKLMNSKDFYVYANGGSDLLKSFYVKKTGQRLNKWMPFLRNKYNAFSEDWKYKQEDFSFGIRHGTHIEFGLMGDQCYDRAVKDLAEAVRYCELHGV